MGYRTIWVYPWDFLLLGSERVAQDIASAGLDAVSCAAKYHSVEHLLCRGKGNRFFAATASVYFRPQRRLYQKTSLQPILSPLCQQTDPLAEVCRAADKKGLKVIAWTVFLHDSALGRRHPDACMVNAFGDVYYSNLCPANPEVREFVRALVQDLSRYPLFAIECESLHFGGVGHYHGHEKIGIPPNPPLWTLLGLCFCPHCRYFARKKGLRLAGLRSLVEKVVLGALQGGGNGELKRTFKEPDLKAFFQIRAEIVSSLVAEARSVSKVPFSFILMGSPQDIGASAGSLEGAVDRYEILAYTHDAHQVRQLTEDLVRQVKDGERCVTGLQAYYPASPNRQTLIATATAAAEGGAKNISFYHYGIMPPSCLDWVRQAVHAFGKKAVAA
ncbi:MAG: family 10 glycosylhydrolase [Armatimonadetes bacterium]|nr:family 10 glycosylhydrolase [Armatimonadota bacterium]MDW8121333.1 hypothetical protein [Armatimonadota bacterium]